MNINTLKISIFVFIAIACFAAFALAQRGNRPVDCPGYGSEDCPQYGAEDCPRYGGGGWEAQLSEEERAQVKQASQKFFEETKDLRDQLASKRSAMADELAKETPDSEAAAKLQGEVSNLKAQLDQKRLEHQLEMKKINPNLGGGYGPMKGPGARGGGYGRKPCCQ